MNSFQLQPEGMRTMLTPEQSTRLQALIDERREALEREIHADAARSRDEPYTQLTGSVGDSGDTANADVIADIGNAELSRDLEELRALEVAAITPERFLLLTRTGDETLDYRLGVEKYRGARQYVIPGGDHGFGDFGDWLDVALAFCGIDNPAARQESK